MLWEGSLVMVDSETRSLWSHIMGECMRGPLEGSRLPRLPSVMAEWGEWKQAHPDTTVVLMPRSSTSYSRGYIHQDAGLVIGLVSDAGTKSWAIASLFDESVIHDELDGTPLLATMQRETFTATIYDRRVDGKTLTFEMRDGVLTDQQTESAWNLVTGQATSGPLLGHQLVRQPGIVSDAAVWSLYYDDLPDAPEASHAVQGTAD